MVPGSVVTVVQTDMNKIVIKPHAGHKNKLDWSKLWRNIELARSHKGKYKGSLSEFVVADREERR